jgi:mitochondrial fission protein ELM1
MLNAAHGAILVDSLTGEDAAPRTNWAQGGQFAQTGHDPVCWCITDGRQGMVNQAVGLAEAMGLSPVVKTVHLKPLWRALTPHLMAWKRHAISPRSDSLLAPWPDLLIATGRPSILPSLYVKGQSQGRTFTVQLQDPVSLRHRFDRIVVPAHDGLAGPNVIVMDGALHRLSPAKLEAEAARWRDRFAAIPQPRLAVLLGGNNSRYTLGQEEMARLADQLAALASQGFGLLVTPSRRTDEAAVATLRAKLSRTDAYIWDGEGDNPYMAILGSADAIIVTCDSVNMITEAASTGKPVHVVQLPPAGRRGGSERDKFVRFHRKLEQDGRLRFFDGSIQRWSYEPLREMERVASLIWQAYAEHAAKPAM